MTHIAVLGAAGFVGSAVAEAAEHAGHKTLALHAPRLNAQSDQQLQITDLATRLKGVDVVVNCAGDPNASAVHLEELRFPNSVLPGHIGAAARMAGVSRYVHVSSAVVQGRRPVLDSSEDVDGFSPYAQSKIAGERAAHLHGPLQTTVYRPPSVHAATRRVTRQLTAIARSPLATVATPGDRPTPQAHIDDIASAILLLCTSATPPPPIVHHPWQGHTTAGLLRMLADDRSPRQVPEFLARIVLRLAASAGQIIRGIAPHARRLELVWLGQGQDTSWLSEQGWHASTTEQDWIRLGRQVANPSTSPALAEHE